MRVFYLYQIDPKSEWETVTFPSVNNTWVGNFEPMSLFVKKIKHVFDRQRRPVGTLISRKNGLKQRINSRLQNIFTHQQARKKYFWNRLNFFLGFCFLETLLVYYLYRFFTEIKAEPFSVFLQKDPP